LRVSLTAPQIDRIEQISVRVRTVGVAAMFE